MVFSFYQPSSLQGALYFEKTARKKGHRKIAGVDEAGRGPLAGPLVVAACMLSEGLFIEGVDDSKKLTPGQRQALYIQIKTHPKIIHSIEVIEPAVVDELNIFQATLHGMREAVLHLSVQPDFILVDGTHSPFPSDRSQAIIKGDHLSHSIACASILAKVTRDAIMEGHDLQWPEYGFAKHKGYPTRQHIQVLQEIGPCPIHRKSYAPVREALNRAQENTAHSASLSQV
ncbi:MAG: ribonuclease HII [Rhabdochlamydiaceae bacterium]|nr:ribonuclease HII [Rhabdochlamydiaceae bacterium]